MVDHSIPAGTDDSSIRMRLSGTISLQDYVVSSSQVSSFLEQYCSRHPAVPSWLQIHLPVARNRIHLGVYAVSFQQIEFQFELTEIFPNASALITVLSINYIEV